MTRRITCRWESSLWLNSRQVYLGGFATEEEAAHAYDLAALGCKGPTAETNFPADTYASEMPQFASLTQVCPDFNSHNPLYPSAKTVA